MFRKWREQLPATIEVAPVELPGHGASVSTIPFKTLPLLIDALCCAIEPHLNKPFALFGHSMGAIIGFELARMLRRKRRATPLHLFASGCGAPQIPRSSRNLHSLPDAAFLDELRRLNGTSPDVLTSAELVQLLLPTLRADFAICETYAYSAEPPLNCGITVFGGADDKEISYDRLCSWKQQTTSEFTVSILPGDHFFLHSAERYLLDQISQRLNSRV
jgi:medium-chain acyl-[acyl-carrier-protein] hydrolase